MLTYYKDIMSRIKEEPRWFDENGVPRYCHFDPRKCANIYARECCLFHIKCQGCGKDFNVCMSWNTMSGYLQNQKSIKEKIQKDKYLHYGDPPNVECCSAGPTMNSVPVKVLEFWDLSNPSLPKRVPECEIDIRADWWDYDET